MAHYTEARQAQEQRETEGVPEGKCLFDCTAYTSFKNQPTREDEKLTVRPSVGSANGEFKPTHRTTITFRLNQKEVKLPALKADEMQRKLLSTHDLVREAAPIVLLEDSARLMKTKDTNRWLIKNSTKIADKVNKTYVMNVKDKAETEAQENEAVV